MSRFSIVLFVLFLLPIAPAFGQEQTKKPATPKKSVEAVTKMARPSIVVIKYETRPGQQEGLGAGFVVSADGLIATNLHVIGEARPINVQLENGKVYPVTEVHASDRSLDLALLKIDAKDLTPLRLGDSTGLEKGESIVALGHPQGLKHSVVRGVVSGTPKVEGKPMIQLAIPIEVGNSGGPVLDMNGRVQGIVTLKSLVTANLGFAVPVNELKKLLERPNPIPMSRWVTIGRLNPEQWVTVFKGNWRQRSGLITVEGPGEAFGGRSLCLSKTAPPELPFEFAVTLKLGDESGAGGLAFHADGGNKHYGFYPSNGKLRLSRFEGPDVFSWQVLEEIRSEHYQPGQWNTIKVRIEKDKILCYVNDRLEIESTDDALKSGKVGLVKFRRTHIQYKRFRIGKKVPSLHPPAELVQKINRLVEKIDGKGNPKAGLVAALTPDSPASITVLREQAKMLERKAAQLRKLATAVHHHKVLTELRQALQAKQDGIDLLQAALLVAKLDNEELNISAYMQQVERMAREIEAALPGDADDRTKLEILSSELFKKRGFHGSRTDFYNKANSYIHTVLDDREGLPITLSILYIELARRLGIDVVGIGLPGRFMVQHRPENGKPYLIDVFDGGDKLTRKEVSERVFALTGEPAKKSDFAPLEPKAILVRLLLNLSNVARDEEDLAGLIRYQDAILLVEPQLVEQRLIRAAALYQNGHKEAALDDLDWLLEKAPPGVDRQKLIKLRQLLEQQQ